MLAIGKFNKMQSGRCTLEKKNQCTVRFSQSIQPSIQPENIITIISYLKFCCLRPRESCVQLIRNAERGASERVHSKSLYM